MQCKLTMRSARREPATGCGSSGVFRGSDLEFAHQPVPRQDEPSPESGEVRLLAAPIAAVRMQIQEKVF